MGSSITDYVNTGWATNLSGSWTISFFTSGVPASATLFYIFGDLNAASFRCFTNGVAGANNWILRATGMSDVLISGAADSDPHMTTVVYDQTNNVITGYKDGIQNIQVAQGPFALSSPGPFQVGGYDVKAGLNGTMADFRIYSHALSAAEVSDLYTFVTMDTPLSVTTTPVDASCNGDNDGSATATPSGGMGPFDYLWSPSGGSAATASGLSAGTYNVTVTDNFGLTAAANATIAEPVAVTFDTTSLADAMARAPYAASISASGGTGTITYSVTAGALPPGLTLATDGTLTGTAAVVGNYLFTVGATDANGCPSAHQTFGLAVVTNPDVIFIDGFDNAAQ